MWWYWSCLTSHSWLLPLLYPALNCRWLFSIPFEWLCRVMALFTPRYRVSQEFLALTYRRQHSNDQRVWPWQRPLVIFWDASQTFPSSVTTLATAWNPFAWLPFPYAFISSGLPNVAFRKLIHNLLYRKHSIFGSKSEKHTSALDLGQHQNWLLAHLVGIFPHSVCLAFGCMVSSPSPHTC